MNSWLPHLPVIVVIVPLLVAPLVALLREPRLAWAAATVASLFSFAIACSLVQVVGQDGPLTYAVGNWAAPYGIALLVDSFSALLLLIVSGASSLALLLARNSLGQDVSEHRQHYFYTAWLLALAGLSGILVSADAFNIFVFMEIAALATYILIAGSRQRQGLTAVFKYLIMGTIGATFYLIGVGLIYMMTGTLNLADMQQRIQDVDSIGPLLVAGGFITVGLALKAAVFPLHTWLPNAYACAPHAVTVFIAACSTKVSLYVLLRIDFLVFQGNLPGHVAQFSGFILPLAVLAILAASAFAIMQRDLKRLLAYSSVAQVGIILLGVGMVSVTGLTAGVAHMFNHALAKGALFAAVACLGSRYLSLSLDELSGAAKRMPWTMGALVLAGLSLIGLPGTAGFISKWYLVLAALEHGASGAWLIAPVLASSLMAVVYIWKVVEPAYFGKPPAVLSGQDESNVVPTEVRGEAPWPMLATLWLLALLNVYFGLQPQLTLRLAEGAARNLLGSGG